MKQTMGAWIPIKGPFGKKLVEPGYILEPWESVDKDRQDVPEHRTLNNAARHFGMDVADFIEWAARCLGVPPCPKCQMSKLVLYRMNEIGWLHGIALLWRVRWGRDLDAGEIERIGL